MIESFCGVVTLRGQTVRKGFVRWEALRLLRTNSVKESFELKKKEFLSRLIKRGYPQDLVQKVFADAQFSSRNTAMRNKPKSSKKIFPFVRTFNPANQNVKKILMKHWHLISDNNNLVQMYPNPPIVTCRKVRSLKDSLDRTTSFTSTTAF